MGALASGATPTEVGWLLVIWVVASGGGVVYAIQRIKDLEARIKRLEEVNDKRAK